MSLQALYPNAHQSNRGLVHEICEDILLRSPGGVIVRSGGGVRVTSANNIRDLVMCIENPQCKFEAK